LDKIFHLLLLHIMVYNYYKELFFVPFGFLKKEKLKKKNKKKKKKKKSIFNNINIFLFILILKLFNNKNNFIYFNNKIIL